MKPVSLVQGELFVTDQVECFVNIMRLAPIS